MCGMFKEHVVGSVIRNYRNLCATLSTPQYGFQKGLKIFKESGHEATIKELDKNLICKNVLDMLDPKSVTFDMMKMSLGYLMFLKSSLTRQFYEFSIHCCSFPSWHAHFFKNSCPVFYFTISSLLVLIVHGMYGTPCYYTRDVIFTSPCRLLFYTIYHDKAQQ